MNSTKFIFIHRKVNKIGRRINMNEHDDDIMMRD